VTRIRPAAWLMASVALFLLAVAGYALLVHASPQYYWKQIDTAVYRDGGIAARNQPAMLYALGLGPAKLPFTYTPFAALLFAVGSGASFVTWQVGLAVLTIGLLPVVAYLSLGLAGRPAGLARAAAAFAIAAVGLWLEPVAMTLFFGQINLVLLALVVGDLALPDRIRGKGIGIGLAAGIKLTPLIFIPYLLFTRRIKTAAVSALTFAVTVGLGFTLLPRASTVYWGGRLFRPSRDFHLDNQSLNGVILRLTHAAPDAHEYWLVAAFVVGIAGLATSILASRRGHELLGLVACAATGLLVSPVSWSHHYVYVVPALVLAAYGPRRLRCRILGAALLAGLFGWWPVPIGSQGGYDPNAALLPRGLLLLAPNRGNYGTVEFTWRGLELIVGNYYVLTLLVFIAATACALMLAFRIRPERVQSVLRARRHVGGTARPATPGRAISFLNETPGTRSSPCERTPPDETTSHALARRSLLAPPRSPDKPFGMAPGRVPRRRHRIRSAPIGRVFPATTAANGVLQQQARAWGDRGKHEHRVEGGNRDPAGRTEPGCGEGPGGSTLPRPPTADTQGDPRGDLDDHQQRDQFAQGCGGAGHPSRDDERRRMPGDDQHRG
jgi:alpha-1,2-mannosyltransferase